MMSAIGDTSRPLRNMRDYAKYRNEMSSIMHDAQFGKKNSQYGKHWYTNRDTGECNSFLTAPNEKWILGRNLFHGEFSKIYGCKGCKNARLKNNRLIIGTNTFKKRFELYKLTKNLDYLDNKQKTTLLESQQLWDLYHSSNCSSILDFCNKGLYKHSRISLIGRFKKYIPYYSKFTSQGKNNNSASNPNLIGIYE